MKDFPLLPAMLFGMAILWKVFLGWLRHRSFVRNRKTGFSPGTQHLSLIGTLGALALLVAAVVLVMRR